jgi:NADH dehydrogenase
VVILGAGFAGCSVARLLGRDRNLAVTLVDPHNFMLYTPLLPEAASGTVEPRHAVVPVRLMCPRARLVLGSATAADLDARRVSVTVAGGARHELEYDHLIVALGAVTRTADVPGLIDHGFGFKTIGQAIALRNRVLGQLERAAVEPDPAERERLLTFVFVGGGYAGVEALAELEDLVRDASRRYPELAGVRRRWVLVDMAESILHELPGSLAAYSAHQLERRGVELLMRHGLAAVDGTGVTLDDGSAIPAATVVWTAGVRPSPALTRLGLELDGRGRVPVDPHLRVAGRTDVWALGDAARVENPLGAGPDPPTCQHALRQARRLAANLRAAAAGRALRPYAYRMRGQVATLGRHKGVAEVYGYPIRGFPGWWLTRTYHLYQLPLLSRKLRVVTDWTVGLVFRRDIVELGDFAKAEPLEAP